jgi:ATP-dependent Clp protease ATP-binding subunit ClpA
VFERFTDRARRVLNLAQEEARLLNHGFIGTEHILLGLIHEGDGVAAKTLETLDISLTAVRRKVEEIIGPGIHPPGGSPPFTPRAKKVLELALREALQLGHSYIGTEHILLGLVREGEGVAAQVLVSLGTDLNRVRQTVVQFMSGHQAATVSQQSLESAVARPRATGGGSHATVGRRWSAEIVSCGRHPESFAAAYDQLAELASRLGLPDLDASRLHLSSVETDQGPGLRLSVTHELPPDAPGHGGGPEPPPAGTHPDPAPVDGAGGEDAGGEAAGAG